MIYEIKLNNWKSFGEATMYIDPLTIIIGANASGKSNFLDCLSFLERIASGLTVSEAIEGNNKISPIRGGFKWICRKTFDIFSIDIKFRVDSADYIFQLSILVSDSSAKIFSENLQLKSANNQYKDLYRSDTIDNEALTIQAQYLTGKQGGKKVAFSRDIPIFRQLDNMISIKKDLEIGIKQLSSSLKNIFVFEPIPQMMREPSSLSESLREDASNLAGVLAALDSDNKKIIENKITSYLKSLPEKDVKGLWAQKIGPFDSHAMLICREGWDLSGSEDIDATNMSDGTLRYVAIIAALLLRPENSLLVIEEIDNGLHPSRSLDLLNMLKTLGNERKIDILATTHNPSLLDAAGNEMIPFISVMHRDDTTGESLISTLDELNVLPKLIGTATLGDLSSNKSIEIAFKEEGIK